MKPGSFVRLSLGMRRFLCRRHRDNPRGNTILLDRYQHVVGRVTTVHPFTESICVEWPDGHLSMFVNQRSLTVVG